LHLWVESTLKKIIDLAKNTFVFVSSHIIEVIEPYLNGKYYVSDCAINKVEDDIQMKKFFIND
jgi:ABC-2 type transport system ATP-binding protein